MMNTRLGILFLVLCTVVVSPALGHAQAGRDLELNFYGGAAIHSKSNFEIGFPQSARPIQEQFKFKTGVRGGVRLNVFNSGHWGQEFVYSFEPNDATFVRRTPPAQTVALPIHIHQASVNGLYYFSANEDARSRVFASFGLGAMIFVPTAEANRLSADPLRVNIPGFGSSSELAVNYGLGFKSRVGNRIGFRADMKGFTHRKPSFDLPRSSNRPGDVVLPNSGVMTTVEGSVGIVFFFGR